MGYPDSSYARTCGLRSPFVSTLIRKLTLGLRETRAQLTTRRRARLQFASTIALGLMAAAAVLLLDGLVIWGLAVFALGTLASWLVGIWVVPGGNDAYYRRVTRVLRESFTQARADNAVHLEKLRAMTHSIAVLAQPKSKDTVYRELLAECEQIDDMISGSHDGVDQMFHQITSHQRRLLAIKKTLEQDTAKSSDNSLAPILGERALAVAEILDLVQHVLDAQCRQFVKMRSPREMEAQHRHYVETLDAYISALRDLCQAMADEGDESKTENLSSLADMRRRQWRSLAEDFAEELRLSWVDPRGMAEQATSTAI
jgi:hypothetical protein